MKIALLWHMHQPSYVKENTVFLPWVFLHAIKDYYDMPYLASEAGAKVTFNLTPTLLEQLLMYEKDDIDYFLILMRKHTQELSGQEKNYLVKILKSLNYETMVKENGYLTKLYNKQQYTEQELLDFEVLFLLSWCGNYLKHNNGTVKRFLNRCSFTQKEKLLLIDELLAFVRSIVPFYKKLFKQNRIDITTTPFYHPILPLLIDMNTAKKANSNTILPKGIISLKDDAVLQVKKAISFFKDIFGECPKGFWPSEGAVDEKSVEIYKQNGIKWIATDEVILKKSGKNDINKIYNYKGVNIFFRNHGLSDLIGFTYKNYKPEDAVRDFKSRLLKGVNVVILDGENAWEYYKNNAKEFLECFYNEFKNDFVFFEGEGEDIKNLSPGSWIYGDFNTWVGDEEKNRAWELLFDTKRDYLREKTYTKEAEEEFLKAEGSDWFWWYGKGHFTQYSKEFDFLYREHLKNIYKLSNIPYPKVLDEPIVGKKELKNVLSEPKDYIYPTVDGKVTDFFEWIDAGILYEGGSTMQANELIKYLYWGENEKFFYIRLDGDIQECEFKVFFEDRLMNVKTVKKEIVEIEIDKKEFVKSEGVLRIEVFKNGKIIQILPSSTRLYIKLDNNYLKNWYV